MSRLSGISRTRKVLIALAIVLFFILAVIVLPAAAWLVGDESFTATSDGGFCADCHTMQPFMNSNADSVHGGVNSAGVAARCTACHLPHDSSWNYLTTKLKTGVHDIWAHVFGNSDEIDWKAKAERREEFVYDSGCLACHVELETATADQRHHDNYFAGVTDSKCVTCHAGIGHSNVNQYLLEHKYRP